MIHSPFASRLRLACSQPSRWLHFPLPDVQGVDIRFSVITISIILSYRAIVMVRGGHARRLQRLGDWGRGGGGKSTVRSNQALIFALTGTFGG